MLYFWTNKSTQAAMEMWYLSNFVSNLSYTTLWSWSGAVFTVTFRFGTCPSRGLHIKNDQMFLPIYGEKIQFRIGRSTQVHWALGRRGYSHGWDWSVLKLGEHNIKSSRPSSVSRTDTIANNPNGGSNRWLGMRNFEQVIGYNQIRRINRQSVRANKDAFAVKSILAVHSRCTVLQELTQIK